MRRQNILIMLLVGLMGFISPIVAKSQSVQWFKAYTQVGSDTTIFSDMKLDSQGNIYLLGCPSHQEKTLLQDTLIIKYAPNGSVLWQKVLSDATNTISPVALLVDGSDNLYVSGYNLKISRPFIVKYDPQGNQLYYYGHTDSSVHYSIERFTLDAQGNLYVAYDAQDGSTANASYVAKFTPSGTRLWLTRLRKSNYEYHFEDIVVDATGNVYVTGNTFDQRPNVWMQYALLAKFNSSGVSQWVYTYSSKYKGFDDTRYLLMDNSNNLYLVGTAYGSGYDILTMKCDANGKLLWWALYDGAPHLDDAMRSVALDSAGTLYVSGFYYDTTGNAHGITYALTPQGKFAWKAPYTASDALKEALTSSVLNGNTLYVTGSKDSANNRSLLLLKYDPANGRGKRNIAYLPKGYQFAQGVKILVDTSGNIYVGVLVRVSSDSASKYQIGLVKFTP